MWCWTNCFRFNCFQLAQCVAFIRVLRLKWNDLQLLCLSYYEMFFIAKGKMQIVRLNSRDKRDAVGGWVQKEYYAHEKDNWWSGYRHSALAVATFCFKAEKHQCFPSLPQTESPPQKHSVERGKQKKKHDVKTLSSEEAPLLSPFSFWLAFHTVPILHQGFTGLCVYCCSLAGGSLSNPWSPKREFVYLCMLVCVCRCAC